MRVCTFDGSRLLQKDLPTRKEQAAAVVKTRYPGIVFSMLDQKNYQEAIWKLLYSVATRSFKIDIGPRSSKMVE